ncbi:hypothetical protein ACFLY4_08560 [Chloroflexota bacterium]
MDKLGKETIRHNQDVEDKYNALTTRKRELSLQLGAVDGEQNQILGALGELVASGAKYKMEIDRLAALRSESEALEAGILYLKNQCDLLKRMNAWIT